MIRLLGCLFVISVGYIAAQRVVNRVWLVGNGRYMVDTIQKVMNTVEDRGWHTLKLPDIEYDIDEFIFTKNYTGSVTYKNGFLVSIQHMDVLTSSLSQIWNISQFGIVQVYVRGQLRLTDVTLGYDIEADLEDGMHHYTGTITHTLLTYDFWVVRNPTTHEMTMSVLPNNMFYGNIINILPRDPTSDALTTMFFVGDTGEGVINWSHEVFLPIFEDVVRNRVPFPDMCYNCPLTVEEI